MDLRGLLSWGFLARCGGLGVLRVQAMRGKVNPFPMAVRLSPALTLAAISANN